MPKSITIRDVPDDVAKELAARAALGGRSLQEYLRGHLIDFSRRPDIDVWLSETARRTGAAPTAVTRATILDVTAADRR